MEGGKQAHADLRSALVREVKRLAEGHTHSRVPQSDLISLTRTKIEPMVRGLFSRAEQELVLAALEKSVVVVTQESIESIILEHDHDGSAWTLANLYLGSVDAGLLAHDAERLVGLSEETTCYVTPEAFQEEPFADFVVHEAAHVFHNCKRRTVGLPETRTKEWLLDIEYRKRETFAYSCETYARIIDRATSAAERRALAEDYGRDVRITDERVDPDEVAGIVMEAASVRNGWKIIHARCAPPRRVTRTSASTTRPSPTRSPIRERALGDPPLGLTAVVERA